MRTSSTAAVGLGGTVVSGQDEQASDRVHEITLGLRSHGWSEEAILAAKVGVTMSAVLGVAYLIALGLNAFGAGRYLFS